MSAVLLAGALALAGCGGKRADRQVSQGRRYQSNASAAEVLIPAARTAYEKALDEDLATGAMSGGQLDGPSVKQWQIPVENGVATSEMLEMALEMLRRTPLEFLLPPMEMVLAAWSAGSVSAKSRTVLS